MLNYDLSPFYRSTVGFDRLLSMLDKVAGGEQNAPTYPPYNIERTGENAYRITLAVAGFGEDELSVETRDNTLTVRGSKETNGKNDGKRDVLYQGIAARAFERRFQLADHVVVTGASSENGLLHIDLVREVPEAQKPRTIAITRAARPSKPSKRRPHRLLKSSAARIQPRNRASRVGAPFSCLFEQRGGNDAHLGFLARLGGSILERSTAPWPADRAVALGSVFGAASGLRSSDAAALVFEASSLAGAGAADGAFSTSVGGVCGLRLV